MALVLWFVAGMALVVSGIVAEARIDTRMAQLHYFRAQAAAAGDGAITLSLAEQFARNQADLQGVSSQLFHKIGHHEVEVRMIPGDLLVNINEESPQGLVALFSLTTTQAAASPRELALSVIEYRGEDGYDAFFSPEDIMRVPGVDRAVYDAIRDFITVTNLSDTKATDSESIDGRLAAIAALMRGEGDLMQGSVQHTSTSVRIDAVVTLGDRQWLRRRWVELTPSDYSQLPWRITRSEAARPLPNGLAF